MEKINNSSNELISPLQGEMSQSDRGVKVLFFGDIVGKIGRNFFFEELPKLKEKYSPNLIIVNGENSANGRGITNKIYQSYLKAGVNCITSGNHIYDNKDIIHNLDEYDQLICPLNYPENTPGNKIFITEINKTKVAIVNMLGQVFMPPIDNPFHTFSKCLDSKLKDIDVIIVDLHAEATSEKKAFAMHFSKEISAVLGTHTHTQTADAQIINNHTGFITDVGMVGGHNSILGMNSDSVIEKFLTQMPTRLSSPEFDRELIMNYVYLEIDTKGKTTTIEAETILKSTQSH